MPDKVIDGVNITDSSRIKFNDPMVIKDVDWLRNAFMVPTKDIIAKNQQGLYFSSADHKLTDASLGGSRVVNPRPQITRFADIRRKGRRYDRVKVTVNGRTGNHGMGRYYSEAYDDNANRLMISCGVPHFQSLIAFLARAVDVETSNLANEGRTSYLYTAAKGVSAIYLAVAFPGAFIVLYGIKWIAQIGSNSSMDEYYEMKPMMHLYWSIVNTLTTYIASNLGLLIPELMEKAKNDNLGIPLKLNQDDLNRMKKIAPHIFTDDNFIDVFAVSNRANVLINRQLTAEHKLMADGTLTEEALVNYYNSKEKPGETKSFQSFLDSINNLKDSYGKKSVENQEEIAPATVTDAKEYTKAQDDGTFLRSPFESVKGYLNDTFEYFKAATSHGGQYVGFDVEYLGPVTDSFSNTFKDIPTESHFNSASGNFKDIRFSIGGAIGGDIQKQITDGVKDIALGVADGLTAGVSNVVQALMGGGYIHMPQMHADSSTSIATHTFKTTLISPYGHPLASIQSLYIPLSCLLAAVLPLSTGSHSYTSPLLSSAFMRGMVDIKLGMFKELTITRGVSNLPYSNDKRPLSFDVSFSIVDLSNLVKAPVSSGIFGTFSMSYQDNTPLNRYLNTITARDITTNTYTKPKALLALSRAKMSVESVTSPAFMGSFLSSNSLLSFMGSITQDNNIIEGT